MEREKRVQIGMDLKQQLHLSAQLLQSMEILQMNSQELLEYLHEQSMENPVMELEKPAAEGELAALQSRFPWLDSGLSASGAGEDGPDRFGGRPDRDTESLEAFLRDQLERKRLPARVLAVAEYLAANLTEDGYLLQDDIDALRELSIPEELTERAVRELQALDPAGVAAADLRQCLLLQLKRLGKEESLAWRIVEGHLQALGRKQYDAIARALSVRPGAVRAAEREIAALDPRPGSAFYEQAVVEYVCPDVFVVREGDALRVLVNEYYLPRLTLNGYYLKLLEAPAEAEVRSYLQQKVKQARWVADCLERRHSTLRRCGETLLEHQRPFFEGRAQELQPMTLRQMAEGLGVHTSTVSRALRGKYLQCEAGTYPIRWFFSRAVGGGWSAQRVRLRIGELVRREDKRRPLSDQKLADCMAAEGAAVARRTVAKYREAMGIPAAARRRRA